MTESETRSPQETTQNDDADALFRDLRERLPQVAADPEIAGLLVETLFAEGEKRWKPTLQKLRTFVDGVDQ